jgi:hypothetical protein
MTHYIETKTKDGALIRIEVEDTSKPSPGFTRQSTTPTNVTGDSAENSFDDALQSIKALANGLVGTLKELESVPSAATIDFSAKIDGEVGAMIAKRRDEGQFKVTLSWKEPEPDKE